MTYHLSSIKKNYYKTSQKGQYFFKPLVLSLKDDYTMETATQKKKNHLNSTGQDKCARRVGE